MLIMKTSPAVASNLSLPTQNRNENCLYICDKERREGNRNKSMNQRNVDWETNINCMQ